MKKKIVILIILILSFIGIMKKYNKIRIEPGYDIQINYSNPDYEGRNRDEYYIYLSSNAMTHCSYTAGQMDSKKDSILTEDQITILQTMLNHLKNDSEYYNYQNSNRMDQSAPVPAFNIISTYVEKYTLTYQTESYWIMTTEGKQAIQEIIKNDED